MDYDKFVSEQHRIADKFYQLELAEQFEVFARHSRELRDKTIAEWRSLWFNRDVEWWVQHYVTDVERSLQEVRDSHFTGQMPEYKQSVPDGDYVKHNTPDGEPMKAEYPHPWMIQVRKEDFRLYLAMQMRSNERNADNISSGIWTYVHVNWNSTF